MKQVKQVAAFGALTLALLVGKSAAAADGETAGDVSATADLAPASAAIYDGVPRLDERTAVTVGARTLKLGVLAFDYGVVNRFSVGTDPPMWAARAFISVFVPNLHFKFVVFERQPIAIALQVAGYYARLNDDSASGNLLAVPVSLFASWRMHERWWLHGEGTYNFVKASGAGNFKDADLGGNVATRTIQLGAMLEFRVRRNIALTAVGRYQVYSGPLAFGGTSTLDPFTTVDVEGQVSPRVKHPWSAIGGVAFLWKHVHLSVGVGYGYYFIPGIDIAYPKQTIIPDATFSVLL